MGLERVFRITCNGPCGKQVIISSDNSIEARRSLEAANWLLRSELIAGNIDFMTYCPACKGAITDEAKKGGE